MISLRGSDYLKLKMEVVLHNNKKSRTPLTFSYSRITGLMQVAEGGLVTSESVGSCLLSDMVWESGKAELF